MENLGARISEARKNKKIFQKELAQKLGVAKSTISGYEAGFRKPDPDTLLKLAKELDVTVDYLVGHKVEWVNTLPPNLQKFVIDPDNRIYLHLAREVKESGVLPETMISLVKALITDAKYRLESGGSKSSPHIEKDQGE